MCLGITSDIRLYSDILDASSAPLPPPDEQAAIVRFLDWANGRLERAIRAKRKVIALLNEQKQAIIHRAVTRGLDPSVPLKPSGIPWLGDIPQHWEVVRLELGDVVDCSTLRRPSIVDGWTTTPAIDCRYTSIWRSSQSAKSSRLSAVSMATCRWCDYAPTTGDLVLRR